MDKRVTTGHYWEKDGMGVRAPVLQLALMIESKAKWAVEFINTENPELAAMVNWDFNKRIDYLKSLKALTPEERGCFTLFQHIRNKLLHVLEARTLVDCFRLMDKDPKDSILNLYPQDKSLPLEDQIHGAMQLLIDDIGNLLDKIEKWVIESVKENSRASHAGKAYMLSVMALGEVSLAYSEQIKAHFASGGKMTAKEVEYVPMELMLRVKDETNKRFRVLLKERFGVDMDKFDTEGPPSEERV